MTTTPEALNASHIVRVRNATIIRVRWMIAQDLANHRKLGATIDALLNDALDTKGVPQVDAITGKAERR